MPWSTSRHREKASLCFHTYMYLRYGQFWSVWLESFHWSQTLKLGGVIWHLLKKLSQLLTFFFLVMLIERRSNSTTSLHVGGTRKYSFEFCIENCKNASETIDFNRGYLHHFLKMAMLWYKNFVVFKLYQG